MDAEVRVSGLKELRSALRQIDTDLPKELSKEFGAIAARIAAKAAAKVPRRSGRAAASVVGRSGGKIAFGGSKAPHFPWLNFGGRVGRGRSIVRERVEPDRYIYTTIRDENAFIRNEVDDALKRVVRSADFETKD